jgi:hypothetical protein
MFGNGSRKLNLYENGAQMCRAWENGMFVVTANAISSKPGTHQFALSQIISPDGRPIYRAEPEKETLLVADLDLDQSTELRRRARHADRRQIFTSVALKGSCGSRSRCVWEVLSPDPSGRLPSCSTRAASVHLLHPVRRPESAPHPFFHCNAAPDRSSFPRCPT